MTFLKFFILFLKIIHFLLLYSFLLCLHNCFLGAAWLSQTPRGKSCQQTGSSSQLGDMLGPAALLKSARLLGFELELLEEEINLSLSTVSHWLPLQPPSAAPHCCHNDLSSSQVESQKEIEEREKNKNKRECNSSSKHVNMVSGD